MDFAGAPVLALESRRANEIAELIRINGGNPFVAPSLVEVPLADNRAVFHFAERLFARQFDMVIFLTGVGTRLLGKVLGEEGPDSPLPAALREVTVVARGPKPIAVLREWQVPVTVSVPEPNTWRELLSAVEHRPERCVAVQEYGRSNRELKAGLEAQGRNVSSVPVYQWRLPEDTSRLHAAIQGLLEARFAAVLFTTGVQIDHLLQLAEQSGSASAVVTALRNVFVASIGPDCTEALQSHGIEPSLEPSRSKMGILVREAARQFGLTRA